MTTTTTNKENPMPTTARPNRYAGPCNACGETVPAGEGILAGRMVGGSRCWLVRHVTCTPAPAMPTNRPVRPAPRPQARVNAETVAFVGKLILEEGSIAGARAAWAACHEFWDGEPEARAYGEAEFDAALVPALQQNLAIHGETRCAECDRPGRRPFDCIACQHDSGLG